jgi:hypothetical protein
MCSLGRLCAGSLKGKLVRTVLVSVVAMPGNPLELRPVSLSAVNWGVPD